MNTSKKSVIVRDRQGLLYAIPSETLQAYCLPDSDFDSASAFYLAAEDDVTGQRMMTSDQSCDDMPWDDMPWNERPANSMRMIKKAHCF